VADVSRVVGKLLDFVIRLAMLLRRRKGTWILKSRQGMGSHALQRFCDLGKPILQTIPHHPVIDYQLNFRAISIGRRSKVKSIQHQRAVGSPDPATCEEIRKVPSAAKGWM
jgi:hypothetical protein